LSEHTFIPLFSDYLTGTWYDYVPGWYATVGYTIVFTMGVNIVMPFVALGMAWGLPYMYRVMDVGFGMDHYKT